MEVIESDIVLLVAVSSVLAIGIAHAFFRYGLQVPAWMRPGSAKSANGQPPGQEPEVAPETASNEHDAEIGAMAGRIARSLRIQSSAFSDVSGLRARRITDNFSLGYIGGYIDAALQSSPLPASEVIDRVVARVFDRLFARPESSLLLLSFSELRESADAELLSGVSAGAADMHAWLEDPEHVPAGWTEHVLPRRRLAPEPEQRVAQLPVWAHTDPPVDIGGESTIGGLSDTALGLNEVELAEVIQRD